MHAGGSIVAIRIEPPKRLFSSCVLVCSSWQEELWVGWDNGGARKGLVAVHEASGSRTDVAMPPLPLPLLLQMFFEPLLFFSVVSFFFNR